MTEILIPVLTLSILGLIFGVGLAIAAKRLHVHVDPRVENVFSHLPGANCGACGQPGCAGFAEAISRGEVDLNACVVCDPQARQEIAKILNLSVTEKVKKTAVLHCQGGNKVKDKYIYQGIRDCIAATQLLGGPKECAWGCIGFGTCAKVCPFGAITMNKETDLPVVNELKCTACGKCVAACPKKLFSLVPLTGKIYVACKSEDAGGVVMKVCGVGCIGCKKCEKACVHGSMIVINNLARMDYSKCSGCIEAVKVCPTKVIIERQVK